MQEEEDGDMGDAAKIFLVITVVALFAMIVALAIFCLLKKRRANQPMKLTGAIKATETMGTNAVFDIDDAGKAQYDANQDNGLNLENLVHGRQGGKKGKTNDADDVNDTI